MNYLKIMICIMLVEAGIITTKYTKKRMYVFIIFGIYGFAVLWITLLSRFPETKNTPSFSVLTAFKNAIVVDGGIDEFIKTIYSQGIERAISLIHFRLYHIEGVILNILLFIPLGYIAPTVQKIYRRRFNMFSLAITCSGVIELLQSVWYLGIGEIDDVINNTIGALIGFELYRLFISDECNKYRMKIN